MSDQIPIPPDARTAPARRRSQAGMTMTEMAIFLLITTPLMIALASTVNVFTGSTAAAHHRTTANGASQRVLQRIAAELGTSSGRIDHTHPVYSATPHATDATSANSSYDWSPGSGAPAMDTLHGTLARDGSEYFHVLSDIVPGTGGGGLDPIRVYHKRRFFIYATYEPFDTIEYQRVRTPRGAMNHLNGGGVSQPWSARRKIFLEDGAVILRVDLGNPLSSSSTGPFRETVLGTGIERLEFHVNESGHFIIRVTATSGDPMPLAAAAGVPGGGEPGGHAPWSGARAMTQVVVNPRNGLF